MVLLKNSFIKKGNKIKMYFVYKVEGEECFPYMVFLIKDVMNMIGRNLERSPEGLKC